ncbi:anaerobic ribonucleoside-triphosphate reductase [Candidatus Woesearchaeota archaeon]|nr:anaerobic ribonucleoside-triphosphate reductase [Candidatus Woesearchaeota archaeon]
MDHHYVKKRDGKIVSFDRAKIAEAIFKAAKAVGGEDKSIADSLANDVAEFTKAKFGNKIPTVEDIQDCVEKVLIEKGHAKTAKAFILYRDRRSKIRAKLKVRKTVRDGSDSTDLSLLVAPTTKDTLLGWDREKIIESLEKEADLSRELAEKISVNVEERIINSGIKQVSTSLIRELIDNEMFDLGLNINLEKHSIIGMPKFDVDQLIFSKTNENSNVGTNNPEAVNLAIAENTLKQYALKHIFSRDVAEAHWRGAVHLHDLGYPVRVYCSAHSLEFIKKYGLRLINLSTTSGPAKHAQTLTGHLNTFLASMQAYYAGALGIGYINILYAPLLRGMSEQRMKQEAQYLIFSCSQNAFSRGGQTLFIDFNVHLGIPSYLKETPAIGAGGKYMWQHENGEIEYLKEIQRDSNEDVIQPEEGRILTYGDFEVESQKFLKVMMDVWRNGDSDGKVFPFPKFDLHINKEALTDSKQLELLKYACLIASENGSPYFVFDRDEVTLSACCRLRTKVEDKYVLKHPESIRFCGFQNVTINLPQCAYRAGEGNIDKCIKEIHKTMEIAAKAHVEKKEFIHQIMERPGTPLWQVGMVSPDGKPYIELDKCTYILGILGLNECVKCLVGKELHEDDETYKLGLKIIAAMYLKKEELAEKHGLKFSLEESPAESASLRMAKVDLKEFPESVKYVRGNLQTGEVYYTNSIHLAADAPADIIERIEKQGKFNPLIESGAITHVFLGEQKPDPESIFNLVKRTFENTESAQITISPEFTVCEDCHKVSRGFMRENTKEVIE